MGQPLPLTPAQYTAYQKRLFGSHDFSISVDVLTMDEKPTGSAKFLDGQVNLSGSTEGSRRTATLTVSDPAGALDFSGASSWSSGTMWADRLIRVRHHLQVPGVGRVDTTPMVGVITSLSRSGAEVSVELSDKTALATRGVPPFSVAKGTNVATALKAIMGRVGEFRFRLPATKRRLSQAYSVGWAEEASPWLVATRIASKELGMQLIYSCDGYVVARVKPSRPCITVPHVVDQPSHDVDFTGLVNWVRVRGKVTVKTTKKPNGGVVTTTTQPEVITQIPNANALSPYRLARRGKYRYWPLVVSEDAITTVAQAKARAERELAKTDQLLDSPSYSVVPFFHLDVDDIAKVVTPTGSLNVRLGDCSIPLGAGGEMTIGTSRWVSAAPGKTSRTRVIRTRKVKPPPPKKLGLKAQSVKSWSGVKAHQGKSAGVKAHQGKKRKKR